MYAKFLTPAVHCNCNNDWAKCCENSASYSSELPYEDEPPGLESDSDDNFDDSAVLVDVEAQECFELGLVKKVHL